MVTLFEDAGASFSPDRRYRYRLWRRAGGRTCLWVMLNPSTADEVVLDPTIRRCKAFGEGWGYHSLEVVNLFALRSTDPAQLYREADPVGPDNDVAIRAAVAEADRVVLAWGAHGGLHGRSEQVRQLILPLAREVIALGFTRSNEPRHPLYLAKDTPVTRIR